MSTYGTKTRTFFALSITLERTCEDYTEPSRPTYKLAINGVELSIEFWRAPGRWSFVPSIGVMNTPFFHFNWYTDEAFLVDTHRSGDYPENV